MNTNELLTKGDRLVEAGAAKLEELSRELAGRGGAAAQIAPELTDDAAFLRRLKPSLIAARVRGEAPADGAPAQASAAKPPPKPKTPGEGPNPLLIVAGALVAGIIVAKVVDWRGHAHPRVD